MSTQAIEVTDTTKDLREALRDALVAAAKTLDHASYMANHVRRDRGQDVIDSAHETEAREAAKYLALKRLAEALGVTE